MNTSTVPVLNWLAGVQGALTQILASHFRGRDINVRIACSNDGSASVVHESYPGRVNTAVMMHVLNTAAPLLRIEADSMTAYWLHEVGHVLFTDPKVWQMQACGRNPAFKYLCNALEDPRQENCMIRIGGAANARQCFESLVTKLQA